MAAGTDTSTGQRYGAGASYCSQAAILVHHWCGGLMQSHTHLWVWRIPKYYIDGHHPLWKWSTNNLVKNFFHTWWQLKLWLRIEWKVTDCLSHNSNIRCGWWLSLMTGYTGLWHCNRPSCMEAITFCQWACWMTTVGMFWHHLHKQAVHDLRETKHLT